MKSFKELMQSGDWKGEKHVPVIHCPEKVTANEAFELKVLIGEAINHPNTLEHHISWIKVFFLAGGKKFPVELGTFNFTTHGEGDVFTDFIGLTKVKVPSSGTILAMSYCNIHGLWENSKEIVVE
ncbi:MAG: superoxide reductase [Clostridiaceae bacterium BRH_c20a]|nr:MAG: superoxide reductase [Clostridiaceae bacterium BRH_c20a]